MVVLAACLPLLPPPSKRFRGDVDPVGSWDVTSVAGSTVTLSGWAADGNTGGAVQVLAQSRMGTSSTTTGLPRPDVNAVAGANRGWSVTIGGFPAGRTLICVGVPNVGGRIGVKPLGCRFVTFDQVPAGNIESVSVQRDQIRVTGWAALVGSPVIAEVKLLVAGQVVVTQASIPRPDVAAAGYGGGAAGFDLISPHLASGTYPICVSTNVPGSPGQFLSCRNVTINPPGGTLDTVSVGGESITVAGWAADVDAPAEALAVRVTADRLDDIDDPIPGATLANGYRPDVAAAYPALGPNHGYSFTFAYLPAGSYRVCAAASPAGVGDRVLLGCRDVAVAGHRPIGSLTSVTAPGVSQVRVTGTAVDPDAPGSLSVAVSVGSQTVSGVTDAVTHVFDVTVNGVGSGVQRVCATASNVGIGADVTFTCGSVVMGATRVATTGTPGPPAEVGPAPGTPLAAIDRDAGISTTLSDGSTLWLFGDSAERDNVGNFRYFVNNTAAWAAPGSPAVTRDGAVVGPGGLQPTTFVTPTQDLGCPPATPSQIMWPLSAVTVPVDATTDRVVAYFQNICLGPNLTTESRGVAVVEWTYHSTTPPVGQPIAGTVVAQQVFPTNTYGNAAVVAGGSIYSYACYGPAGGGLPDAYGPCKVARVAPATAGSAASYQYWNGSTFVSDPAQAAPMVLPAGADGINNPVATLTVTWDAAHGVYVMAYSPWPGFTNKVVVRVASQPQGPWSAPVEVTLPGCADTVGGSGFYCYAGTAQPQFSSAPTGTGDGLLGIGYYDQLVSVGPNSGSYQVVTVPFRVYL